jgi:hypothetical protein
MAATSPDLKFKSPVFYKSGRPTLELTSRPLMSNKTLNEAVSKLASGSHHSSPKVKSTTTKPFQATAIIKGSNLTSLRRHHLSILVFHPQ